MTAALSRALMALAVRCLGDHRREWACAMKSEFEAAADDGKPLSFALGCVAAAARQLPGHAGGRFAIASNLLAIFVIVPAAALLLSSLLGGFPTSYFELVGVHGVPGAGPLLTDANLSGLPPLAVLVLSLAALKVRMAWLALERDWVGVTAAGAMSAAVTVTLVIFTAVVFADYFAALAHSTVLAVELTALLGLARWHAALPAAVPRTLPDDRRGRG